MINIDFEKQCYSCGFCTNICPQNAIKLDENYYPQVDKTKCVDCNLCSRKCPAVNVLKENFTGNWISYVAKSKEDNVLDKSSSGGVFFHLANKIITEGGYVCGCVYDQDWSTKHIVSNELSEVKRMMGSKYVKSDVSGSFERIKELLYKKVKVMFVGTPCQIVGLKSYVGENEYLITVSVVCHGSIERSMWQEYLTNNYRYRDISFLTMRDKSGGWLNYGMRVLYSDGEERISYRNNDCYFLKAFTDGLLERDRCLNCSVKGGRINSDIVLGDAWGFEDFESSYTGSNGLSVVVCQTACGLSLFESIIEELWVRETKYDIVVSHNKRIIEPSEKHPQIKRFRKEYLQAPSSINELCKKYVSNSLYNRIYNKLVRFFR